jgi:thiol-disulfide isomerase/thioredoxin
MAVTKERFDEGMTYQQYIDQITQNKERFVANYENASFSPESLEHFKNQPEPLNVLAIGEDWCGDVVANFPVLAKLADQVDGKLNVRVFPRDQNEDLINQYLNQGKYKSIPVFVFFDQNMRELGHFIERPAAQTAETTAARTEFFKAHPEYNVAEGADMSQMSPEARQAWGGESQKLRAARTDAWNQLVADDFVKLSSGVPA